MTDRLRQSAPADVWDNMPTDSGKNYRHYLYGHPREEEIMPEVFADTGYWIALLNERDSLHIQARELSARLSDSTTVTTEMVLTELLNHTSREGSRARRLAADTVLGLIAHPKVEVVPQTSDQFQAALERLSETAGPELEPG